MVAVSKTCTQCGVHQPLEAFHRHPNGPQGRHSWCKSCLNASQRGIRKRKDTTENRRERLLKQRYGLTTAGKEAMLTGQNGLCAICATPPSRPVVDHCHATGRVRGILCHRCNIKLPAIEDAAFFVPAAEYLRRMA
jgi:hypothetical protein